MTITPQERTARLGERAAGAAERALAHVERDDSGEPDVVLLRARARGHLLSVACGDQSDLRAALAALEGAATRLPSGHPGWGLSYAWDAFGDGTVNPPTTVYAYTTASAALAFIDGYTALREERWLDLAAAACATLMEEISCWRSNRYCSVWYSDQPADQQNGYQVHNVNALALAALTRLDRVRGERRYAGERSGMLAYLLAKQGRGLEPSESVLSSNWRYMPGGRQANDLIHEAFIVMGLLEAGGLRALRAASASLRGILHVHFTPDGSPREGLFTRGSNEWGPPAALFALAGVPEFEAAGARIASMLVRSVSTEGSVYAAPAQARGQAWYALGLARYAALAGGQSEHLAGGLRA